MNFKDFFETDIKPYIRASYADGNSYRPQINPYELYSALFHLKYDIIKLSGILSYIHVNYLDTENPDDSMEIIYNRLPFDDATQIGIIYEEIQTLLKIKIGECDSNEKSIFKKRKKRRSK